LSIHSFFKLLRAEQPKQKAINYKNIDQPGGTALLGLVVTK
jgi:hypothetical protein